jgi:hypothetical protein
MADKNINYWDSYVRTVNPYNPHGLQAEFNITIVEESKMLEIKNKMMKDYGVKIDNMLVTEGCHNEDKVVLGGQNGFLSHFCTFYHFNICHSANEAPAIKNLQKKLSDADRIDKGLDSFMERLDKIK